MAALYAILASLSWGIADFFGGKTSRTVHPIAVLGWSQLIGFFVLGVAVLATGVWRTPPGYWPWSIAGGLVSLIGMTLFYMAMSEGKMGIVSPIVSLSVLIPLVVGLLMGDMPTAVQLIGIIAAIGGIVLASGPELTGASSPRPVILAIASAFCLGFMFITMTEGSKYDPLMSTFGIRVTAVIVMLVVFVIMRTTGGVKKKDVAPIAAVGVLDATANLTFGISSTLGMLAVVAVLGSLYPIVTIVLAWLVLHERLRRVQYFGIGFALVGVALISAGGI